MKKSIQNILLIASIILISGCSTKDLSTKPQIHSNLPIIDSDFVRTIPDMSAVALEWKNYTLPEVKGYHIYRSTVLKDGDNLTRIATVKNKYTSHYLDTNLDPDTQYMYSFSTIGENNFESLPSQTVTVSTSRRLSSVSYFVLLNELPRKIKILWRPHTNKRVSQYIIQRRSKDSEKWKNLTTIKQRLMVEYIDEDIGDNMEYAYRMISVTFDGIKSIPTKTLHATTKKLPQGILGLTATSNIPRKIQLSWTPSTVEDMQYYKIYRGHHLNGKYTFIMKARIEDDTFVDYIQKDDATRYYKVTVVDKDDLESTLATTVAKGKTLAGPSKPTVVSAMLKNSKITLKWKASDKRTASYNIYKTIKKGFFSNRVETISNIKETTFEDKNLVPGLTYKYNIEAIDENGLLSRQTQAMVITIPKVNMKTNATPTSK